MRRAVQMTSHRDSLYILYDDGSVMERDKYGCWYKVTIPQ